MSNDVKLERCPFCGGPAQIIAGAPGCYYVRCEGCSVTSDDGSRERVITKWNTRHQPQREATWEEVRKACRFPCPGHYRAKVRGRFQCTGCGDILTTSEHAALTTPAPLSEHKVVLVEEAARRIYEHYEFGVWTPGEKPAWAPNGNSEMQDVARAFARAALSTHAPAVSRDDQALFNDICDKMAEVVAPLPGEE